MIILEDDIEVKWMAKGGKNMFLWPLRDDVSIYSQSDILLIIDELKLVNKRHYKLPDDIWCRLESELDLD